jgi:hypothetical protein
MLLLHAWSGSCGDDTVVTTSVLATFRSSASAPSGGGPIRRRHATAACGESEVPVKIALVDQH